MRRLYLSVWFTVVASGIFGMTIGLVASRVLLDPPGQIGRNFLGVLASDQALRSGDMLAAQQRLQTIGNDLGLDVLLLDDSGKRIAASTTAAMNADITDFPHEKQLTDGRRLLVAPLVTVAGTWTALISLALIGVGVAVATYPIVRRITRRLEQLKTSVESLGAGNFDVQVEVRGNDEVAGLAESFNQSVKRISTLIDSNRSLLANASHELRSPLARVRMAVELLTHKLNTDAAESELQEIRRSIAELDALVDEILTGSSLERVGFTDVPTLIDLHFLIEEECSRVGARLKGGRVKAAVHPVLYRRMVRNLLENAVKYGRGNAVEVELEVHTERIEIKVVDEGIGVPPTEVERIFEPFYRRRGASEVSGGVGLGLSLAREIARKHGGDIDCRPNVPQGSIFCVWLPNSESAPA
jgi:signal transduction histidine kinase